MEYYIKSFVSLRTLASWLWHPRASELFLHSFQHFQATFSCGLNSSTTKNTQHRWCHGSFYANAKSRSRQINLRRGNTSKVWIVSANKNSSTLACFEQLRSLNIWEQKRLMHFGFRTRSKCFCEQQIWNEKLTLQQKQQGSPICFTSENFFNMNFNLKVSFLLKSIIYINGHGFLHW